MPVDFLTVRRKIREIGLQAPEQEQRLSYLRQRVRQWLSEYAHDLDALRQKVEYAALQEPYLRCALPFAEALNARIPEPPLIGQPTVLAADGSQINPDRHEAVEYYLVNVGAIEMRLGSAEPPRTVIETELFYGDQVYGQNGIVTEDVVALQRDQREREVLARLAAEAIPPVIALTDGPLELWGGKGRAEADRTFSRLLEAYQDALRRLAKGGVIAAGYVDKPRADLVVQMLEVAHTPQEHLEGLRNRRLLPGVSDADLFLPLLASGERSAVFGIQSKSAVEYSGELALHFFYVNVGARQPWLARVEIPRWVAQDEAMLNHLHAVLLHQCRLMGSRAYPYILHRAHEVAVVTLEEKDQINEMLIHELMAQGVPLGEGSHKQAIKRLSGRRRFKV